MKVRLTVTGDYVLFVPEGTDYVVTDDFGVKRRTELDGVEFVRLPVRNRARFGACANVAWDGLTAVAVMGLSPEVRISGEAPDGTEGWRLMVAGTEGSIGNFGYGAALIAGENGKYLDRVDALERDCNLPRVAHPCGEYGRHLDVDDCLSFYRVDQNTEIQDEIAGRLAELIDECGFRVLYFDGGEDVP
jgi:hypothetical protein